MEEDYYTAYHIVSYKYDEDYPYFSFLVVALYALLHYYSEYKDIILKLFQNVDIYIEDDSVFNILKKHHIEPIGFDEEEEELENSTNEVFAISSRGDTFDIDEDGNTSFGEEPLYIACRYHNSSVGKALNNFIHEFSHLVKCQKNSLKVEETEEATIYKIRCGINILCYTYDKDKDIVHKLDFFSVLDEAINVIQTTEMMQEIASLKEFVREDSIKDFLNHISEKDYTNDLGYSTCVKAIRPLWDNNQFRESVKEHIVKGSINSIFEDFDAILGEDTFEYLGDSLDELDDLEMKDVNYKKQSIIKKRIKEIINFYNKNSRKVYQK